MTLHEGYLLPAEKRRKMLARSAEVSLEGLRELVDDELLGPAAVEALRCVDGGADPRMLLLVLEAAIEGYFEPQSRAEADRQRYEQRQSA